MKLSTAALLLLLLPINTTQSFHYYSSAPNKIGISSNNRISSFGIVNKSRFLLEHSYDNTKLFESDVEDGSGEEVIVAEVEETLLQEEEEEEGWGVDGDWMRLAVSEMSPERSATSPFPRPSTVALLVHDKTQEIIALSESTFEKHALVGCLEEAGVSVTPLKDWVVSFPSKKVKQMIGESTLYLSLEPRSTRKGMALPPITKLIEEIGVPRVVVGAMDPCNDRKSVGCSVLHANGIEVIAGVEEDTILSKIPEFVERANSKFKRRARIHYAKYGRPLGFLHCSVIDSNDAEAFVRSGNAFARTHGSVALSERDYGCYEIAPPPESIWAPENDIVGLYYGSSGQSILPEDDDDEDEVDFLEEKGEKLGVSPMMPWYEQADAVVATFPKSGNGPSEDNSIMSRLTGLKWLATHGETLPPGVERILVMDAADLTNLPLTNEDENLPVGVDIEKYWKGGHRKPARILLRHGSNAAAAAAAKKAAAAAAVASVAAEHAMKMAETGDAEDAADAALEAQKAAEEALAVVQQHVDKIQEIKEYLGDMGVAVESIKGGEPIDVMNHLGERSGYDDVIWRAGCWGSRGVKSIMDGAFQWVSAHLAVDAHGGPFWQLMLAERCIQAACGPESKVKVLTEQDDISLEYCDDPEKDCVLKVDGKPIRHVRVDCRVAVVNDERERHMVGIRTVPMPKKFKQDRVEEAPWFL